MTKSTILLVDDDVKSTKALGEFLELDGFEILIANTVSDARLLVQSAHFALVDVDMGGEDTNRFVRECFPGGNYMRYTGNSIDSIPEDCRGKEVLMKPTDPVEVSSTLSRNLGRNVSLGGGSLLP